LLLPLNFERQVGSNFFAHYRKVILRRTGGTRSIRSILNGRSAAMSLPFFAEAYPRQMNLKASLKQTNSAGASPRRTDEACARRVLLHPRNFEQ